MKELQQMDRDNDYYDKVISLNGRYNINIDQLEQEIQLSNIQDLSKRTLLYTLVAIGLGTLAWNAWRRNS
ncbi:hypothetical protein [Radiobacillus sp. PE A8.2]|uniref:hypothetical protein n=1 Tax=Radiobacillus sp. PE A8.2 TaxID=3380349 RepID=UPI00388F6D8B